MKIYLRASRRSPKRTISSKKYVQSDFDYSSYTDYMDLPWMEDEFMTFEDWYDEYSAEVGEAYLEKLKDLIEKEVGPVDIFSEPSIQGWNGADFTTVTLLENGKSEEFSFDWEDEMDSMFNYGPNDVAEDHAKEMIPKLKKLL